MLEFMDLYDRPNHATRGKFKLSHFEIGKLLKCAIDTDEYGNIYYRTLTTCIRDKRDQSNCSQRFSAQPPRAVREDQQSSQ